MRGALWFWHWMCRRFSNNWEPEFEQDVGDGSTNQHQSCLFCFDPGFLALVQQATNETNDKNNCANCYEEQHHGVDVHGFETSEAKECGRNCNEDDETTEGQCHLCICLIPSCHFQTP